MEKPMIEISGLGKEFEQRGRKSQPVVGLDDVSFNVDQGEFFVLLGPSGSGKTTCLRMLAGLDRPTSGRISIDGTPVFDSSSSVWVGPETRPQAMVFQSYALWPQMTVYKNIEFPLRHGVRKVSRKEAHRRVENVLGLLGLDELATRKVTQLSGGQQQRVALARALALEPKVLLMDEPLSNLDVELRSRVRDEIKRITTKANITTVLVTHDQEEAFAVGDKIAILNKGRVEQVGEPEAVYKAPGSLFVANFLDKMNIFEGVVTEWNDGTARVDIGSGLELSVQADRLPLGTGVTVGIRPSGFTMSTTAVAGAIPGTVEAKVFLGATYRYDIATDVGRVVLKTDINNNYNVSDRLFLCPFESACAIIETREPKVALSAATR